MTAFDRSRYEPAGIGPTGLFLDTSGLFAYFFPDAEEHEAVRAFFDGIADGDLPYRPLVTNTHVVDELATLLVTIGRHEHARSALETLDQSDAISIRRESTECFEQARERFLAFDDREISFTDHYCGAQMHQAGIEHVLSFDGDYGSLGFDVVPR